MTATKVFFPPGKHSTLTQAFHVMTSFRSWTNPFHFPSYRLRVIFLPNEKRATVAISPKMCLLFNPPLSLVFSTRLASDILKTPIKFT